MGMLTADGQIKANIPDKDRSQFAQTKWQFLLAAPFDVSNKCCYHMKKSPAHRYTRLTCRYGITAQMASESRLRTQKWIQNGCNGFDLKLPVSNPMSFWTEQDVLLYIYLYNLPIAPVYGEVVIENEGDFDISEFANLGIFEKNRPVFKTTGCDRTGCIFCGFGCHLEKEGEGRFKRLKSTHPKIYDYLMKSTEDGGLGYKEVIDWLNEHGNLHIEY